MSNILDYLRQNREKVKLVAYFAIMVVLAVPLTEMLGQAWEAGNFTQDIVRLRLLVGLEHQAVSISAFGIFLGLLVLITIDPKKRWQAFLLWLGTILGLLALQSQNLLIGSPNFHLMEHIPFLIGGVAIGMLIGGGRQLLQVQTAKALEFRKAASRFFLVLATLTVVGFLELHLQYPDVYTITESGIGVNDLDGFSVGLNSAGLVPHAIVSGAFIVTLNRFVQYDAEKDFFILGPRASGKSLFLIGAYLEALETTRADKTNTPLNPSEDLMSMLEALDRQDSEWIVEATGRGQLNELRFQFVHGSVFPINVRLSAMDYAGEYLDRIPDALTGAIPDEDMDTTLRRLAEGVEAANSLILVIDVERFINNEPLEVSEYFTILQAADNKSVTLVATKSDILAEEYEDERGLEPHLYYDDFTEFVTQRLRQSENIDALIAEAGGTTVLPVYYQTKENENGNRVPMRDDTGSVMTVGFDHLLERLGRL